MWQRLIRLISTGLSAYSFYSNPLRFILTLLCMMMIPYLAYIFWGSVIILALAVLGVYLIYRMMKHTKRSSYY